MGQPQPETEPYREGQQQSVNPAQQQAASPGRKANEVIGDTSGLGTRQVRLRRQQKERQQSSQHILPPASAEASHLRITRQRTESSQRWLVLEKRDQISVLEAMWHEASTSDADDHVPRITRPKLRVLAALKVDETNTKHDPEPNSEYRAAKSRDNLRGRKRWPNVTRARIASIYTWACRLASACGSPKSQYD